MDHYGLLSTALFEEVLLRPYRVEVVPDRGLDHRQQNPQPCLGPETAFAIRFFRTAD